MFDESGVTLDTNDHFETLETDILTGKWDKVIEQIRMFKLPHKILIDIYLQIIIELIEMKEYDCSSWLFTRSEFQRYMKQNKPEKLMLIQRWLTNHTFEASEAYAGGKTRDKVRAELIASIRHRLKDVQPSRLLTLLGQSLKWQQAQGILPPGQHIDIFLGKASEKQIEPDAIPKNLLVSMKFNAESYPECALFTPDGQYLITGSADGFIEIWNYSTGKLRKDLIYQAQNRLMVMESSILCLTCSDDSKLLASGSQSGKIRIWNICTGVCVQKFEGIHQSGTNCVRFYKSDSQLFSCSFDSTIKLLSISSGKILKEFRGHTSFVYDLMLLGSASNQLLSASADSSLRIWNIKTTECIKIYRPMENTPIYQIIGLKGSGTGESAPAVVEFLVCLRSNTTLIMNSAGKVLSTLSNGKTENGDFISTALSPTGNFAYCMAENRRVYAFNLKTSKLEIDFEIGSTKPLGLTHHPFHNICAIFGEDAKMHIMNA
ncbi:MAG: Serine/threonine-protein kinase smu1 [Marteilia pararefringens]